LIALIALLFLVALSVGRGLLSLLNRFALLRLFWRRLTKAERRQNQDQHDGGGAARGVR